MLTDEELASMRDTLNDSLPGTAIVQTSAWVSDGGGGGTTSWVAAGTYDCRISPTAGREDHLGDRVQPESEYLVTLPGTAAVQLNNRLSIGGEAFTVINAGIPKTWAISQRVLVKEID